MSDTLILNSNGLPLSLLPISAVNWHLSIKLLVLDKFKVIDEYENWTVHSPSMKMQVPSVMMATKYLHLARHPRFSRNNVYLRDLFTCQYCGCEHHHENLTLDHVLPRSKGGKSAWENIVTACFECNISKGDDKIVPMISPYRPDYWELANKRSKFPLKIAHESWKKYIKWDENLINVA
tara:strand:+ start:937 stop:1473 length:537 start_codon:yes stop_codon:yes gene_type:complete